MCVGSMSLRDTSCISYLLFDSIYLFFYFLNSYLSVFLSHAAFTLCLDAFCTLNVLVVEMFYTHKPALP